MRFQIIEWDFGFSPKCGEAMKSIHYRNSNISILVLNYSKPEKPHTFLRLEAVSKEQKYLKYIILN